MWAKAAKMLNDTTLKYFFGRCMASHNISKLMIAPPKLRAKVGDKNWPSNRLLANTRKILTQAAVAKPYWVKTYSVTILAIPGLTPGMGDGITASIMCRAMANAASLAMRWSSAVVCIWVVFTGFIWF